MLNNLLHAFTILGSRSFIIPDELPSILSVIYSNIPTVKKGTDSRFGWGFRLGDRADFQVITELGPQIYTQPLGNQGDGSGNNKRNALNNLANTLYAQRQQDKKIKQEQSNDAKPDTDAAKWLKTWSKSMNKNKENEALPMEPKPGLGIGEIDAKSVIPEDSVLLELEQKKKKSQKIKVASSTEQPKTTTFKEDALTNVDKN
ncbi:hypothetical protein NQ318_016560 [Aromia moschata]|uniref:Uncharacterized protein n=1 Tax=Aromia moschata TaxID=1265417 RepID=A0AAV8YVN3_9CUCU|nr:hypothetical protein NQ318_016560 [Aromia moschata]